MSRRPEREGGRGAEDAEHHLAEFAAIVASSTDAIIGKTLDGVVTSWNAGAEQIYGYTADEMIGRSVETIVPTDKRGELREIIDRLAAGEATANLITERERKDGTRITVAISVCRSSRLTARYAAPPRSRATSPRRCARGARSTVPPADRPSTFPQNRDHRFGWSSSKARLSTTGG